jgi:hypothetical protein
MNKYMSIGQESVPQLEMILEFVIVCILVLAVCIMAYRGANHEFQILQREYIAQTPWDELLNEQLPVVIRGLPKSLLGGWTEARTYTKRWPVTVLDTETQRRYKTTWDAYLQEQTLHQPINMGDIAAMTKLDETLHNWTADGFHKWYWVPTSLPTPVVAQPSYVMGVKHALAEATLLTNTEGGPLHVWLAHGGAIPRNVIPSLLGKNPWTQTTDDIPWIGEVKYVEIIVRPGNALLIPRHWYYAVASNESPTWYWIGEFHSPVSWMVRKIKK